MALNDLIVRGEVAHRVILVIPTATNHHLIFQMPDTFPQDSFVWIGCFGVKSTISGPEAWESWAPFRQQITIQY
jgi:hypothetical protein